MSVGHSLFNEKHYVLLPFLYFSSVTLVANRIHYFSFSATMVAAKIMIKEKNVELTLFAHVVRNQEPIVDSQYGHQSRRKQDIEKHRSGHRHQYLCNESKGPDDVEGPDILNLKQITTYLQISAVI